MMMIFLLLGCGKTDAEKSLSFSWTGGDFDFTTTAADDSCLDGALEALFMPSGPETPQQFEYPVYLPDFDELPISYEIDLREPFVSMPVTVDAADSAMLSANGVIDEVELGELSYGEPIISKHDKTVHPPWYPSQGGVDVGLRVHNTLTDQSDPVPFVPGRGRRVLWCSAARKTC